MSSASWGRLQVCRSCFLFTFLIKLRWSPREWRDRVKNICDRGVYSWRGFTLKTTASHARSTPHLPILLHSDEKWRNLSNMAHCDWFSANLSSPKPCFTNWIRVDRMWPLFEDFKWSLLTIFPIETICIQINWLFSPNFKSTFVQTHVSLMTSSNVDYLPSLNGGW